MDSTTDEAEFLRRAHRNVVHRRDVVDAWALLAREITAVVRERAVVYRAGAVRHWGLHNHMGIDCGEEGKSRGGPGCGCEHHFEFLQRERNVKIE